nr:hypothetical protein [Tanacetum cinerariifolium]
VPLPATVSQCKHKRQALVASQLLSCAASGLPRGAAALAGGSPARGAVAPARVAAIATQYPTWARQWRSCAKLLAAENGVTSLLP